MIHFVEIKKVMEEICYSETSVLTRATRRTIQEYGILHSHCLENLSYSINRLGSVAEM
jgi:hypothetical protein